MCFSFEISIGTFIFSWSICLYLLTKKLKKYQRDKVIFILIVSSIQLADAILWYNEMKMNNINYIVTSFLIPFLLTLQIYFNVFIQNKTHFNIFFRILALLMPIYIFYRFNGYSKSLCNNKLSSPIWGSNEIKIWEFILFAILIIYPNWIMLSIILTIMLPVLYIFFKGSYGSLWCVIANITVIYYLYKY
jgi:hypothetical protein